MLLLQLLKASSRLFFRTDIPKPWLSSKPPELAVENLYNDSDNNVVSNATFI